MGSTDIENRIADERKRLMDEEAREAKLSEDRAGPLEAGDDIALDAIEDQINASRTTQLRIQERIALLSTRLSAEQQREESERIDAVAEKAQRARAIGEALIRKEYTKAATVMAETLRKLRAIDAYIDQQNKELDRAGRDLILSPNHIRYKPAWTETKVVRRRVGIDNPNHPHHQDFTPGTRFFHRNNDPSSPTLTTLSNGQQVEVYVEVDITEETRHWHNHQAPLYEAVETIPSPTPEWLPLYTNRERDWYVSIPAIIAGLGL